eukprot:10345711-Alexandrium_andersonii.AAC.1
MSDFLSFRMHTFRSPSLQSGGLAAPLFAAATSLDTLTKSLYSALVSCWIGNRSESPKTAVTGAVSYTHLRAHETSAHL